MKYFKFNENAVEWRTQKLSCGLNLIMSDLGMVDVWKDQKLIASLDTHKLIKNGKWSGDLEELTEALTEAKKYLGKRSIGYYYNSLALEWGSLINRIKKLWTKN